MAAGVDRREFLRIAALGATYLIVPGCRRGPRVEAPAPFASIAPEVAETAAPGLNVFLGGGEFLAAAGQRIPVGIVTPGGRPLEGAKARAWIGQGSAAAGPFPMTYRSFSAAHDHPGAAHDEPHGFYDAVVAIPRAGVWDLMVEAGKGKSRHFGFAAFEVGSQPRVPAPGQPAVSVATPTFDDPRDVTQVCTREPPCPMHEVSLDRALAGGKPVVFVVATPAYCQSRICGPVVDEVLLVRQELGDRAAYLHAEVYRDPARQVVAPVFEAWRMQSEPWTFVVDAAGTVRERFEGPVVAPEVKQALLGVA